MWADKTHCIMILIIVLTVAVYMSKLRVLQAKLAYIYLYFNKTILTIIIALGV